MSISKNECNRFFEFCNVRMKIFSQFLVDLCIAFGATFVYTFIIDGQDIIEFIFNVECPFDLSFLVGKTA